MKNVLSVKGISAVISFDPESELFRGEFIGLNAGADFYASNVADLKLEAEKSLEIFLSICKEQNIEPMKAYSGKFNVRISPELHQKLSLKAAANNISINDLVISGIEKELL